MMSFEEFLIAEATEREIFQMLKDYISQQPEWAQMVGNFHTDPGEALNLAANEFIGQAGMRPEQMLGALQNMIARNGVLRSSFQKWAANRPKADPHNLPRLKQKRFVTPAQQGQRPTPLPTRSSVR